MAVGKKTGDGTFINRKAQLKLLKRAVNEKHGERTMELAGRRNPLPGARLTTGSLMLDYALGGGILIGSVVMFRGSESSGKTSAAVRVAGLAQEICANCYRRPSGGVTVEERTDPDTGEVEYDAIAECDCARTGLYVPTRMEGESVSDFKARVERYQVNSFEEYRVAYMDLEGTFDNEWARKLGCDPNRLMMISAASAEEAIDIYDSVVRTGAIDLIIIDSIAAMTPSVEIEESVEKWQQGLHARLMGKFVRRNNSSRTAIGSEFDRKITGIWINQERIKIGISFGDNTTVPGGEAQKFAASATVKMWASAWEKEDIDADLKKEFHSKRATSVRMDFKVIKNKTGIPMIQGGYRMGMIGDEAGQVLELDYTLAQAEKHGIIKKDGIKWQLGDEVYKSKGEMISRMQEPAVKRALRETLVKKMVVR